jgi:hypothetical protein
MVHAMTPADLTREHILDAALSGTVLYKVAWDALGEPCQKRDAARREICEALSRKEK